MPVTVRRMGVHWPVLAAALLTVFVSATLAAALADFAGQTVPQAVHRELAVAPDTSVLVTGSVTESQLAPDTQAIRSGMHEAFGSVPFVFDVATWSAPLSLPSGLSDVRVPLIQAVAADAIQANSVLVSGHWPTAPRHNQPTTAVLPAAAAAQLHLTVGDVLTLRALNTGKPVEVRLTGEFRPRDPSSEYWRLDPIGVSGGKTGTQSTTYGPLVVDPAALGTGEGKAFPIATADWLAIPGTASISDAGLGPLSGQLTQEQQLMLDSATLGELTMTTNLPALLGGLASNVVVADSLLAIGGLLLLLLDATALTLAARLLASQRQVESAQVAARGGNRWQLVSLNLAEGGTIAVLATPAGVLAGGWLAGLLARTGPLRAADLHASAITVSSVLAAVAASIVCITIALAYPLLDSPRDAWSKRSKLRSAIVRAGIDVALIALAVVAVWELRRYSAVAPSATGGLSVDPVLALAPALALGGGTVLLLRLVPAVARAGDRIAARGRRLTTPLASWQISRRAVSQAGVALLVVLAVATGMLVLSQHLSWQRSVRDQAAFTAGADMRVDTPAPLSAGQDQAIASAPGVRAAMPAAQLGYGDTGRAVAIDASKAASVVLLRPDLAPEPAENLFHQITPETAAPGVAVPARIVLHASLGPPSLHLAPAAVTMSVQDADGNVYAVPAGTLADDGRQHALIADVGQGISPLRLIAVTLRYLLPTAATQAGVLDIDDQALVGWQPAATSPDLAALLQNPGSTTGPARLPSTGTWGGHQLSFGPGFGMIASPPGRVFGELTLTAPMPSPPAIPGIATRAYLDAAGVAVGSIVQISVTGVTIPVRIVAAVTAFPAMTGTGGAVIVDLASVQDALTAMSLPPAPVTEWWLSTRSASSLTARLPPGSSVTIPGQLAATMLGDPLSAAPQQAMLAIAVAAALLALAGLAVSIATSMTERRAQSALLAALGVSRSAQARQLCLEELILSVPAAAAGLVLGAVLGWLLVPAVTLTSGAVAPVPPALTEFAWSRAVPLAVAVAALPVLVAAVTVVRRPDPATRMRTAEAT